MPRPAVQRKGRKSGSSEVWPGALANPTTSPQALMAIGVFQPSPPRVPRSAGTPRSQSTACVALTPPTAMPHAPEMPTTWPRSLTPSPRWSSPSRRAEARGAGPDRDPRAPRGTGASAVHARGSITVFCRPSRPPAANRSPRWRSRCRRRGWGARGCARGLQTTPRQVFPDRTGKKKRQLQRSPQRLGPPSVSATRQPARNHRLRLARGSRCSDRRGCRGQAGLPARPERRVRPTNRHPAAERPVTHRPKSLMAFPKLKVPPSEPRGTTMYRGLLDSVP